MIRFLLSLLLVHFSLTLMSCSSSDTKQETTAAEDGASPINDTEIGDTAASAGGDLGGDAAGLEGDLGGLDDKAPGAQAGETAPPADDLGPAPSTTNPADDLAGPTVEPGAPPAASEKAQVRDIRYMANANGGTVVIETSKPVQYQSRMNTATQQFVIEIADVELPAALQRPYNMKEFGSRFGGINAYQGAGSNTARIVIQLAGSHPAEPIVQQEGTSLVVIPPTPAPVATHEPVSQPGTIQEAPKEGALQARTLNEFLTGTQKFVGKPISLQVKDADVRDVVNFLAEESGANIVMSDDVSGKISLKLRKIPWDQALITVMRTKGLGYTRQGNVLRISTLKALQTETEASNKLIEAQKAIVPAIVQVIPISYAAPEEIVKAVTPFLTKNVGQAVVDNRSSTLIVTDRQDALDRIQKLVKTLDIQPAQVSIESKIVEAVEGLGTFLGVNWQTSGSPVPLSTAGGANGSPIDLTMNAQSTTISKDFASASPFKMGMSVGVIDFIGSLGATLTLAENESLAKVISAPRISTMNREKSTIIQASEALSVISTRVGDLAGSVTKSEKRTPYKLELSVTPQITSDGGVIMDLDVQRDFLGPVVDPELQARAVNTRKAKTKVLVHNGQTAVIGGIYTSDESEQTNGIPGLKNIPIIGWLFKTRTFNRDKNELLIFLTPRILSAEGPPSAQASN